jgi:hypothetical protein
MSGPAEVPSPIEAFEQRDAADEMRNKAPAGIVKTDADTVLALLDADTDHCKVRNEFFEGREQSDGELKFRQRVFMEILKGVNRNLLERGVVMVRCIPESKGFGARFLGVDRERRDYSVDFGVGDEARLNAARMDSSEFVRENIGYITDAILAKRAEYLRRGNLKN